MNVNDPRWASIDAFVEENRDNILRDITRLVAVPSVEGAPEPGAPFGPGPKAALAKALEIADELGLDTFNADSYIGWAETGRIADGQNFLATITHTDVVPEGNGWDADPYTCLLYTSDGITTNFGGDHNTLIVHNQDTPGHVAAVTTCLSQHGVNIATMQLYRSTAGGYAVMVLECDEPIPDEIAGQLGSQPGIVKVTILNL